MILIKIIKFIIDINGLFHFLWDSEGHSAVVVLKRILNIAHTLLFCDVICWKAIRVIPVNNIGHFIKAILRVGSRSTICVIYIAIACN